MVTNATFEAGPREETVFFNQQSYGKGSIEQHYCRGKGRDYSVLC